MKKTYTLIEEETPRTRDPSIPLYAVVQFLDDGTFKILRGNNSLLDLSHIDVCPGSFPVTFVSKADVAGTLFGDIDRADEIDDDEMEYLARKMGDDYVNQLFWSEIKILGENIEKRIHAEAKP